MAMAVMTKFEPKSMTCMIDAAKLKASIVIEMLGVHLCGRSGSVNSRIEIEVHERPGTGEELVQENGHAVEPRVLSRIIFFFSTQ